MKVQKF